MDNPKLEWGSLISVVLPSHMIFQHSLIFETLPAGIAFNCPGVSVLISNVPLKWASVVIHVAFWTWSLICKLFAKLTSQQLFIHLSRRKYWIMNHKFSTEFDIYCERDAYDLLLQASFLVSFHRSHNWLTRHPFRACSSRVLQCWLCGRNCCKLYTPPCLQ